MVTSGNNHWRFFCIVLLAGWLSQPVAAALPALEKVIQHQFPQSRAELQTITDDLFNEYQQQHNIVSLIFYSYGMLKLADRYAAENNIIKASEYARTGFFYLDEAAELKENDPRVRYLRARVDAFLPADLGRCVIALSDTQFILTMPEKVDGDIRSYVRYMRYRALYNCRKYQQATALLAQIKQANPHFALLALPMNATPEWNAREFTQIVLPLAVGDK